MTSSPFPPPSEGHVRPLPLLSSPRGGAHGCCGRGMRAQRGEGAGRQPGSSEAMAAHQAPPSLGFSRQEHWSGCHFLPQDSLEMVPKSLQAQTRMCTNATRAQTHMHTRDAPATCAHTHTHTRKRCSWHNPLVFFEREVVLNTARGSQDRDVTTADNEICVPGKS